MNEEMEKLIGRIKEVIRVMKKRKRRKGGRRWRDGECNRKKRQVEKTLEEWRRGNRNKKEYIIYCLRWIPLSG